MVTSEDQSSYDVDYSNGFTYRHEYHYNNSEIYDESIIDDPCDSSTYEIAKEFYNDLECFIMDNDNDSILEQVSGVVEFEFYVRTYSTIITIMRIYPLRIIIIFQVHLSTMKIVFMISMIFLMMWKF